MDFWNLRLGIEVSEWIKKKLTWKSKVAKVGIQSRSNSTNKNLDLNNKDIWLVVSNMALIFHDIP
jgi:hypothetical protein